jgi:hypothetical protein
MTLKAELSQSLQHLSGSKIITPVLGWVEDSVIRSDIPAVVVAESGEGSRRPDCHGAYVLTIEDPHRFRKSRDAGCFVGLQPGRRNSGESEPQMRISKDGDEYLRTLLVQGALYFGTLWER